MDGLPVITYAGDQSSFAAVQQLIVQNLPCEQYEWRRSYGRAARLVRVTARFVPFNAAQLTAAIMSSASSLSALPFLHMFWLDCDMDLYRTRVRDELAQWQSQLRALNVLDWLVVVVVHDDNKVKSKILRTSVFDKVKGEFAGRHPERCVQLAAATEPLRYDATVEPWSALLLKVKELILTAYSRQLMRFEERMRAERECRINPSWSFNHYFILQEELAAFYDTLGLYEDALLQYDELDALLTQLVVSYTSSPAAGPPPAWLQCYARPAEHWDGALPLDRAVASRRRSAIREDTACLLDLRSYLLCQQCSLLLRLGQPQEAARRALAATVTSAHELRALDVSASPPGSTACWSLLTCSGALELCDQFKPSSTATLSDEYHAATAGLWKMVQGCLHSLGNLCGLLQARPPSSAQLHLVVQLLGGLRDAPDPEPPPAAGQLSRAGRESPAPAVGSGSPRVVLARQRLLSALSSQRSYEEYYLEVTELTMGTFKHIGHPRTARVLANQLAAFCLERCQMQKAESLLLASLATYDRERWSLLAAHSRLALAHCQTQAAAAASSAVSAAGFTAAVSAASAPLPAASIYSLASTHLAVAASDSLEPAVRCQHFEHFLDVVGSGSAAGGSSQPGRASAVRLSAQDSLRVLSVKHASRSRLTSGCEGSLLLTVRSALPAPLVARSLSLRMRQCSSTGSTSEPPAPFAASGPRLYAEIKVDETGEPTYGVGCSNTRALLSRRDSKPAAASATAAAAAMAAAVRHAPLGPRSSVDSGFLSVPAVAVADQIALAAPQSLDGRGVNGSSSSSGSNAAASAVTFGADVPLQDGRRGGSFSGSISSNSLSGSCAAPDWVLQAAGPIELLPGTTTFVVSGTVPCAGTFRPEELLVELNPSVVISLRDEPLTRCCAAVAWPACNPSIIVRPVQGDGPLLFGIANQCRVTFNLGDRVTSVDHRVVRAGCCELVCCGEEPAVSCSTPGWGNSSMDGIASITMPGTDPAPVLDGDVTLTCDPPDFAQSALGPKQYSMAATWRSADDATSVCADCSVSFQHPFTISHDVYASSSSVSVLVTLSALGCNRTASAAAAASTVPSFDICSVDLAVIGGQPVVLQKVHCQAGETDIKQGSAVILSPDGRVQYLWSLRHAQIGVANVSSCAGRLALSASQQCTTRLQFTFHFRVSDESCQQPFSRADELSSASATASAAACTSIHGSYTFDADCRRPLFEVSKALVPASDYYLMTKECKMAVTIRSLAGCVCRASMHADGRSYDASSIETGTPLHIVPETTVSYEIGSSEEWAISGDKRGKVTVRSEVATEVVVLLVPLTSGCLRLPHVTLLSLENDASACLPDVTVAAYTGKRGLRDCSTAGDACADPLPEAVSRTTAGSDRPQPVATGGGESIVRRLSESEVYNRSHAYVVRVLGANDYT